MPLTLYCGTANPGKLREFQLAAGADLRIEPSKPLDCPETGDTFEANARQKALCYAASLPTSALVFVDDSGIEVDALGGAPGVYSARFAGPNADDAANNRLLLDKLRGVSAAQRTARYVCVIALAQGDRVIDTFRATAEGWIVDQPAGKQGFGYDPYFYFPATACRFAELDPAIKWKHSHRGKAFRLMLQHLLPQNEETEPGT